MYVISFFTNIGSPATGLSPTIRVRNVADNSLVVTDAGMSEMGDGWYKYDFSLYDPALDYSIRCDGGAALPAGERYAFSGSEDVGDVTLIKSDSAAILLDTGTDGVVIPQVQADKVWGTSSRTLTANTNLNDLNAAGVRAAVGLAADNLDTQLSGISSKTTNLPASPAAVGSAMTLADNAITPTKITTTTLDAISANVWASIVEGTFTAKDLMRVLGAVLAGEVSGAEVHHPVFKSITDIADVVDATTDANGNRLSVSIDTGY